MQIQQPNIGTFSKIDHSFLQQMSDNDDAIRNNLDMNAKGIIALGISNNMQLDIPNYKNTLGVYQKHTTNEWIDVQFTQPKTTRLSASFEANRYYKFILHFDYVWAANNKSLASNGDTGRIEIRVRDITHRHDLIYWTNLIDADYNMGGYQLTGFGPYWFHRDINIKPDFNIWAWNEESAKGCVPSSCHATRLMPAKTSETSIIKVQYRPMMAYGGIQPPNNINVSPTDPVYGLPQQYTVTGGSGYTRSAEAIKQFNGYFAVEDCGPVEKPAGAAQGVIDDNSMSPLYEAYENHPYDSGAAGRP